MRKKRFTDGYEGMIDGATEIEEELFRYFENAKENLRTDMRGRESEFLYTTLQTMNYLFGPRLITRIDKDAIFYNTSIYHTIYCLKAILDTIMEGRYRTVRLVGDDELVEIINTLKKHFDIARYHHVLKVQRKYPTDKAIFKNGNVQDLEDPIFYKAMGYWMDEMGADRDWVDWVNWFYECLPEQKGFWEILKREFKNMYGLNFSDFTAISKYFKEVSAIHINNIHNRIGWTKNDRPFLSKPHDDLLAYFSDNMDEDRAKKWIKHLQYRPWADLYKHPLISVVLNGEKKYFLLFWLFVPRDVFWSTWLDPLLVKRGMSSRGKLSNLYGTVFEHYLDEKIKKIKEATNLGKQVFNINDFPEIKPSLDRTTRLSGKSRTKAFEIDRLIVGKNGFSYAISCKASDFIFERKIREYGFFFYSPEVKWKIERLIKNMNEIYIEAECISKNQRLINRLNLSSEYMVPVVLTSRCEPLGANKARERLSEIFAFPKIAMLTFTKLEELIKNPEGEIESSDIKFFELTTSSQNRTT